MSLQCRHSMAVTDIMYYCSDTYTDQQWSAVHMIVFLTIQLTSLQVHTLIEL